VFWQEAVAKIAIMQAIAMITLIFMYSCPLLIIN